MCEISPIEVQFSVGKLVAGVYGEGLGVQIVGLGPRALLEGRVAFVFCRFELFDL